MIKKFLSESGSTKDTKLRDTLKRHDPVEPPNKAYLGALEADILGQLNSLTDFPTPPESGMLTGVFQQKWAARSAIFASVLILALGFIIGQTFFGGESVPLLTDNLSLIAFADESAGQSVSAIDTSWGENDDNAE